MTNSFSFFILLERVAVGVGWEESNEVVLAAWSCGNSLRKEGQGSEEVGHDHVRTKSGRVAPYTILYKL